MNLDELLEYWGTVGAVAKALGASSSAVSEWRETGIPLGRQYQAQIASGGRLRADEPALRERIRR